MNLKTKLLSLLLCALMLVPAAYADEAAEPQYYYPAEALHTYVFIAPSWESLAVESGSIYPYEDHIADASGTVVAGSCLFYCILEPQQPNPAADIALAGIVMYPAGEQPEKAGLEGFSYREVYSGEIFAVAAAWRELDEIALPEGANTEALEALIASFRDTDEYILVEEPVYSLGQFHTTDLDGNEHTSQSVFSGEYKLTLVNVWATYCQPCLAEMPYLGELAEEYAGKGVQIIGIPIDIFDSAGNIDADQVELAKRYAQSTGAEYLHLIPDSEMQRNLLREVYYVPNSWFMDSEGKVVGEALVGSYSKEDWAAQIEAHLALIEQD